MQIRTFLSLVFLSTFLFFAAACGGDPTESTPDAGSSDVEDGDADTGEDADAAETEELAISTTSLPDGNREIPYQAQLQATGGTPPYTWSSADLPPGLSTSGSGSITGTPTADGDFDIFISVTDDDGLTRTTTVPLTIENDLIILTDALPTLHVFENYTAQIEVVGGTPPYAFSASGLPGGLMIDPDDGTIFDDPTQPFITDATGSNVTVTVTDDDGVAQAQVMVLTTIGLTHVTNGANTCVLDDEGSAWCWGNNSRGQLATGESEMGEHSSVPGRIVGDHIFTTISSGSLHTCALDDDGAAWCWGSNSSGQLGQDIDDSPIPVEVSGGHTFSAIGAGAEHTCALDHDGQAWCWGDNNYAQLGVEDDTEESSTPVEVSGEHSFSTLEVGGVHNCGLDDDNRAWCWGQNFFGQLAVTPSSKVFSPQEVQDHTFTSITTGFSFTCGITDNGRARCWGSNQTDELGNDQADDFSSDPVAVDGDHKLSSIATGFFFACAIDDDGRNWCWGRNEYGQLGQFNGGNDSSEPLEVLGDHSFTVIVGGSHHSCALDDNKVAWCWGSNNDGRLGNDRPGQHSYRPIRVHRSR